MLIKLYKRFIFLRKGYFTVMLRLIEYVFANPKGGVMPNLRGVIEVPNLFVT
jgi:hypothetical protein